jgi:DNA repair ATPase RecN
LLNWRSERLEATRCASPRLPWPRPSLERTRCSRRCAQHVAPRRPTSRPPPPKSYAAGLDEAVFLVRPNAGLPFSPVAETASGGELSRIALALAAVAGGETLVFDEIDAGIGGETAHRVAETLQRLAARAQVIVITHLPQIASVADAHFRVEKIPGDPTHTRILRLDEETRQGELERMAGGREFIATLAAGESS